MGFCGEAEGAEAAGDAPLRPLDAIGVDDDGDEDTEGGATK